MGILIYLLIHLITYLYFIYNFYIFILINISYITIVSINDHVIDNMIRESDNLFLKAFIYHNTILSNNNTLYYTNIKLSKYKLYNTVKEYNNRFYKSCDEIGILIISLYRKKAVTLLAYIMNSDTSNQNPLNMTSGFLRMIFNSSYLSMEKPIEIPNPLTYDSDDDICDNLSVE